MSSDRMVVRSGGANCLPDHSLAKWTRDQNLRGIVVFLTRTNESELLFVTVRHVFNRDGTAKDNFVDIDMPEHVNN